MKRTKHAVVLLSGGVDSSTTLAIAKSQGYELYALSFDYGQRHKVELEAAERVAKSLGVKKHMVTQFNLRDIGGSALTSEIEVPKRAEGERQQKRTETKSVGSEETKKVEKEVESVVPSELPSLQSSGLIPVTYVPARNTIFLSFGLAWAEVLEAPDIFIGANAVDYSGYPDCRPGYLKAFEDMANLATKASVEGKVRFSIHAPLLYLTKSEIIEKGRALGLDYSLTWSCYDPQEIRAEERKVKRAEEKEITSELPGFQPSGLKYLPCGRCDSCLFRKKGFEEAGTKDPLVYASGD